MAKEMTTFAMWEKLQAIHEKKLSSSRLILIRQLFINMKMNETKLATSYVNTFNGCSPNSPCKDWTLKKKSKPLHFSRASRWVGKSSIRPSRATQQSWCSTKRSYRSYQKTFEESGWDSPSTTMSKLTSWERRVREPTEARVGLGGEMGNIIQSHAIERQRPIALIAGRPTTSLSIASR